MNYKVEDENIAGALCEYWRKYYYVFVVYRINGDWIELRPTDGSEHSMWREICDAFVAGYKADPWRLSENEDKEFHKHNN